jgi:hypothetical protein
MDTYKLIISQLDSNKISLDTEEEKESFRYMMNIAIKELKKLQNLKGTLYNSSVFSETLSEDVIELIAYEVAIKVLNEKLDEIS